MVYTQPRIWPGEQDTQNSLEFWDANGQPNLGQMIRPSDSQQQKENLSNCELCCSSGPQSKIEGK